MAVGHDEARSREPGREHCVPDPARQPRHSRQDLVGHVRHREGPAPELHLTPDPQSRIGIHDHRCHERVARCLESVLLASASVQGASHTAEGALTDQSDGSEQQRLHDPLRSAVDFDRADHEAPAQAQQHLVAMQGVDRCEPVDVPGASQAEAVGVGVAERHAVGRDQPIAPDRLAGAERKKVPTGRHHQVVVRRCRRQLRVGPQDCAHRTSSLRSLLRHSSIVAARGTGSFHRPPPGSRVKGGCVSPSGDPGVESFGSGVIGGGMSPLGDPRTARVRGRRPLHGRRCRRGRRGPPRRRPRRGRPTRAARRCGTRPRRCPRGGRRARRSGRGRSPS